MSLVLRGATVVDPRTGTAHRGRDVRIEGSRIVAVSAKRAQPDAEVVDVTGQWLVPGFVDMHAHPMEHKDPSGSLALMLAHGITGFRQMSGNDDLLAGARLPVDSPAMLARPGDLLTPFTAGTSEQATASVRHQHERGADFIKNGLTAGPAFFAAQAEAHRLGIPILGHLPSKADALEVTGRGMRSVEHLGGGLGLLACCSSQRVQVESMLAGSRDIRVPAPLQPVLAPLFAKVILPKVVLNPTAMLKQADLDAYDLAARTFDDDAALGVAGQLKTDGTWQVPTLVRSTAMQLCDDPSWERDPDLRYVDPRALKAWRGAAAKAGKRSQAARDTLAVTNAVMLRLVRLLDDSGVRMLAGSDACGAAWVVPGPSLHDEFDLLGRAGLSPLRVLQMTTSDPAEFLGRDSLGAVEAGKEAELVLLGADPLAAVDNLHAVSGVVRAGRYLDSAALQQMKDAVAAARSAA